MVKTFEGETSNIVSFTKQTLNIATTSSVCHSKLSLKTFYAKENNNFRVQIRLKL